MYKRALITCLIYGPRSCEAIERARARARVSRASISRGVSFFNEVYNAGRPASFSLNLPRDEEKEGRKKGRRESAAGLSNNESSRARDSSILLTARAARDRARPLKKNCSHAKFGSHDAILPTSIVHLNLGLKFLSRHKDFNSD